MKMNEALIKSIVQYKLATIEKILDKLPPEISSNLKNLGSIILESIKEGSQKIKDQPVKAVKSKEKVNNIKIE